MINHWQWPVHTNGNISLNLKVLNQFKSKAYQLKNCNYHHHHHHNYHLLAQKYNRLGLKYTVRT